MKKLSLIIISCILGITTFAQDFDKSISTTCDSLARKIVSSQKRTVAIADFVNLDESITQLGVFISNEISAELSNLTDNQKRFKVLERSKLEQIYREKNLVTSRDGSKEAKELGKLAVADILIFATITDFNGYYRITIKLLDTRNGDALSSARLSLVKSPSLESLNKNIIKSSITTVPTPVIQYQPYKPVAPETVKTEPESKGDFCFTVTSAYYPPVSAKITIYKVNSNEIEKSLNVSPDASSCAYELKAGIHKVSIKWDLSLKEPEIKEIRVKAGQSSTINFRYQ